MTLARISKHIVLSACVSVACHTALGESGMKRYPVTPEMVVSAMQGRQLPTTGVQLRLAAEITALSAHPALEIQSISLTGNASAELRVACRNRSDCMPFYVAAAWPSTAGKPNLTPASETLAKVPAPATDSTAADTAIRQGSRATLVIEDDRIHIQLRVISLEAGATGDTIRVTTPDRRQTFTAQILTPTLLKGSF
jgi:hypothetical protein